MVTSTPDTLPAAAGGDLPTRTYGPPAAVVIGALIIGLVFAVVLEQSLALARLGHRVDLFTRRSDPDAPAVVEVADGVRLLHLDAGPAAPVAKGDMDAMIRPFREQLRPHLADGDYDHVPEQAFFMCGGLDDVERQWAEIQKNL